MSLRSRVAAWLQPSETARDRPATFADHEARIAKLELERPAFVAELESMLDTCNEVLDRAESKRARTAARESKARRESDGVDIGDPKAFARLNPPSWKRVQ